MSGALATRSRRKPVDLTEVLAILRPRLDRLREEHGITWLGVFGSYARGEQRRGSDIDLLVEFDARKMSLFDLVGIERALSRLLHAKADLTMRTALKGRIVPYIEKEVVQV